LIVDGSDVLNIAVIDVRLDLTIEVRLVPSRNIPGEHEPPARAASHGDRCVSAFDRLDPSKEHQGRVWPRIGAERRTLHIRRVVHDAPTRIPRDSLDEAPAATDKRHAVAAET